MANFLDKEKLEKIRKTALEHVKKASSVSTLNGVRITYLGRSGEVTILLKSIKDIPQKQRPEYGDIVNRIKEQLEQAISEKQAELKGEKLEKVTKTEWIDVTLPTRDKYFGSLHPLTHIQRSLQRIFATLGFEIVDGPEIETEYYNFESLNIPKDHPARDMWDTFWIKNPNPDSRDSFLLRPHTSHMQVRYMKEHHPPFKVIVPGRCYRYEATDASHENTFNQLEGFVVGEHISVANLTGTLKEVLEAVFQKKVEVRLRPAYYPFVEPGFDLDIKCLICNGKTCKSCKHSGWLELLGCGMIHPGVFKHANYNPKKVSGFAFGLGMDRLAMMKYGIDEIRLFHSGDLRFSQQF